MCRTVVGIEEKNCKETTEKKRIEEETMALCAPLFPFPRYSRVISKTRSLDLPAHLFLSFSLSLLSQGDIRIIGKGGVRFVELFRTKFKFKHIRTFGMVLMETEKNNRSGHFFQDGIMFVINGR